MTSYPQINALTERQSENEPHVTAILLTADRPHMTRQAIECFRAQTYRNRSLIVFDTGNQRLADLDINDAKAEYVWSEKLRGQPIGRLRNEANSLASGDILCHFDSDDLSAPERIADQVRHLQESGADVTGHREVVFWAEEKQEAWVYMERRQTFGIGGSLCYWAAHWKAHPFDNRLPSGRASTSEYYEFLKASKVYAVTSLSQMDPMLLCRIHAGNSSDYSFIWNPRIKQTTLHRAPAFDDYCREKFGK